VYLRNPSQRYTIDPARPSDQAKTRLLQLLKKDTLLRLVTASNNDTDSSRHKGLAKLLRVVRSITFNIALGSSLSHRELGVVDSPHMHSLHLFIPRLSLTFLLLLQLLTLLFHGLILLVLKLLQVPGKPDRASTPLDNFNFSDSQCNFTFAFGDGFFPQRFLCSLNMPQLCTLLGPGQLGSCILWPRLVYFFSLLTSS